MTAAGNGENTQQDGDGCKPSQRTTANHDDAGGATANANDDAGGHLPIEIQLYEVEVTADMDPLEYAFRRVVPVPMEYYWVTGNNQVPLRVKLWHNSIFYLGLCLQKAEAAGEVVANVLGLNDGPFSYVTETITEADMARSRAHIENRTAERNRGVV